MINIKGVTKRYKKYYIFDNLSLEIEKGELLAIVGPNGCGKSTLLNMIAGLESTSEGKIKFDNKQSHETRISFVTQNYNNCLLPWATVWQNISLPINKESDKKYINKLLNAAKENGLLKLKDKYLYQMSGGYRQLTAIYQAFMANPDILLLDEPFSSLDLQSVRKLELCLLFLWRKTKKTLILVSHDLDEAIFLASRLIVLSKSPARIKDNIKLKSTWAGNKERYMNKRFISLKERINTSLNYEI